MAQEGGAATVVRRRSTAGRVAKWVAIVAGALVLLVAALLLGIDTRPGHGFLASRISRFEAASGLQVRVAGIDGSIYGRAVLRGVEVRDTRGAFLTAPAITLDWNPFAYLHGRIDVSELSAGAVRFIRMPVLKPAPSDPGAPTLPDIDLGIRRLRVDRLVVEPAVTGRRHIVRFGGDVEIADRRARINADAAALSGPGIAGGDRLVLKLDAAPDDNRLLVDARLSAPAGGLVDSYAGLGKPLAMLVEGRGDWRDWQGRARAGLAGQSLADLAITARSGRFAVRGQVVPGLMLGGPAARLAGPAIGIDLTATLAERRVDAVLRARSAAMALDAAGLIDLAESRFGDFRVNAQLLRPGAIADNAAGRDVRLSAVLDGPFATPTVAYALDAAALAFNTTGIEGLHAEGRATIDADRILIPVAARARRVTGLNAAAGGLLTNLSAVGTLAYADGKLISDNLRLRSDRIDATAILIADFANGRYTGALKGRVNDYQIDGIGRINLTTDAELVPGASGGFGIRGRVRIVTRRLDNASVANALGGNAVITADVAYSPQGVATVRNLRLAAPDFRITAGEGRYDPDGRIAFRAAGTSGQYGPFTVAVSGTAARPVVRLHADRPNVGIPLADVNASVVGTGSGYDVKLSAQSDYGPVVADVAIRTGSGGTRFDIRRATLAGIDVSGSVAQTPAGPFAGSLRLAGAGLDGSVRLSAAGRYQRADVSLTANGARIPGAAPITIGSGVVRGSVVLYDGGPAVQGQLAFRNVVQGEALAIQNLQARVNYRDGRGTVALVAGGRSGVPFNVAAQASLTPQRVLVNARGQANNIPFRLAAPAVVAKQGAAWVLGPATVVLPQGQVRLSGRYGGGATQGQAILANLDLSIVNAVTPGLGLGGKASGTIDVALPGGAAMPTARARLDIAGFTRTGALVVSDPVDVALLATLSNAGGDARALVRRSGVVVGRLQARLAPIPAGGGTWTGRLLAAPLSGGIRYNGPAEVLWTLTGISGQTVSGPVIVAADFGGRLSQPSLVGVVRANALRYENTAYGTVISALQVDGRFTRSQLQLRQFSGRAGSGTIAGSASVGLAADSGFPIDARIMLDDAQLARSDALGATVSGTLAVTNSRQGGAWIRGDLRLPEVRYQIVRQGAADVIELDGVRRRNQQPVNRNTATRQAASVPSNWKLDVRVRAPNRLFVSGMGLESEWSADLRVTGSANAPEVSGDLDIVRGTYSFAGRRFELSNESNVQFAGGPLTDPTLNIIAQTTVEDVTAQITISGTARRPQIAFTSTPALAQDEVLARLLFGGSVTELSPTQAIQLAAALNSLRGSGGGGLNPLGKLRSASGVDRLRILGANQETGQGTSLAAGKYLARNIYVEIVTDTKGFAATQLDIALSRALSILSSTSSFGGTSVNFRYRKQY